MKTNWVVSMTFAALLLVGMSGAVLAQTSDEDHDAHHPEETEQAPAAQPDRPDAAEAEMPGMMGRGMGMNPDMMRMMQRMMRMQQDDDENDMPGMGMPGMPGMPGMMGMMAQCPMMQAMMGQRGESVIPGRMGKMGRGMMRHDARHAGMMRMVFILMDTDGDGALSLDEVQSVAERIFNAIDADDDGQITLDEIREFYRGTERADRRMPMRDDMPMREEMQMRQGMQMDVPAASQAYMAAMRTMMDGMANMEMTGDPARDFALMMIPHHQSAIDMAEAFLEHGDDPELTQLANEIIAEQRREIEFLENWLREQEE